ncbi:MAG: hypothetical protein JNM51_01025 [Bacteroidia bacterium]|nr:hypothetical protein [Bacteroidia bacterium]
MTKQYFIVLLFFVQVIVFGQITVLKDTREIIAIEITESGLLHWTSEGETTKLPFVIEQFRWNRWIKIGEVNGVGSIKQHHYSFNPICYHGENLFRIKPIAESKVYKEIKYMSRVPEINYSIEKKTKEIKFNYETMYEVVDASGEIVKRGFGLSVSIDNLSKGNYTLKYDNSSVEFKR